MQVLAIVHPTGLLGEELRLALGRKRELWSEVRLLTTVEEEVSVLSEVAGAAALVEGIDEGSFRGVDLVFFCGPMARNRELLGSLPEGVAAIVLSLDATLDDGRPVIPEVALGAAEPAGVLVSPHPGVVVLAHLLHPLGELGLESVAATLIQPASALNGEALDEVLDQTRSILAFSGPGPREIYPVQIAFNLMPSPESPVPLLGQLETVLGRGPEISIQLLRAGVFHSYSVSLVLHFAEDPGLEAVRGALAAHPRLELVDEPELLGPIDAAAREEVLVGAVEPVAGREGVYTLWAVMDNLTCGGASNAIKIFEALGTGVTH